MPSVLITGANRGLGLEFARQYGADGWRVFACCRSPGGATELAEIAGSRPDMLTVHEMDVTDGASVGAVAGSLRAETIDLLVNNAGLLGSREWAFGKTDFDNWTDTFEVNVFGAIRVLEAFSDHVARSDLKQMITISSALGSVTNATAPRNLPYRTSKAAVNMAVRCVSTALESQGVTCVAVSPGWVQTDMGGGNADLTPEQSVSNLRRLFETLRPEHTSAFLNHDGSEIAW